MSGKKGVRWSFEHWMEMVSIVRRRVGSTESERLSWVVRAVQRPPKDLTPGDWDNFCLELTALVSQADAFAPILAMPEEERTNLIMTYATSKERKAAVFNADMRPNQEEAREMLARMGSIIEAAVKRQPVTLRRVREIAGLEWRPELSRWLPTSSEEDTLSWADRAAKALGDLLEGAGALLKECPAPLPRDEEICGTWFVANRPKQEYCSATCQSRASTRAKRHGTLTPAMQRRKEEKEG